MSFRIRTPAAVNTTVLPTDAGVHDAVLLDAQVRTLYEQAPSSLSFHVVLAAFLALTLRNAVPAPLGVGWVTLVSLIAAFRWLTVRRFLASAAVGRSRYWLRLFVLGAACAGAAWSLPVVVATPPDSIAYAGVAVLLTAGMASGAVVTLAVSRTAFLAFAAPALLPGGVHLLTAHTGALADFGVGLLAYFAFLAVSMSRVHRTLMDNLILQHRNARLVEDVRAEKATVERLNRDLEDRVAERTAELARSETKFRALFESASDAILILGADGCVDCNAKAAEMFQVSREQLHGKSLMELSSQLPTGDGRDMNRLARQLADARSGAPQFFEWTARREDGSVFEAEVSLSRAALGADDYLQALVRDITWRKKNQEKIRLLAYYDALTGLPNLTLLMERFELMTAGRPAGSGMGLLVFDIERFADINDALGHDRGDQLLREVARRLDAAVTHPDMAVRFGASVFGVLLAEVGSTNVACTKADAVMSAVGGLAVIGEVQVDIEIRGGIALWPAQAQTFQALLRRASVAKRASFDTWPQCLVYQPEHEVNPRTVTLVAELRAALGTDQLRLHYQPKLDLVTGRVTSAEALLRWKHPDHGFVPPGEFIALAEQTGLITSVTAWVVDRVLAQIQAWRLAGVDIDISLNISARDLRSPGFVELVRTLRDAYDTEPGSVTLELTESTVMKEPERGIQVLGQLKEQGFRLSLDDFGTGYSSLAYLKRLDFHELKIDRAFVTDMLSDREDAYIVRSIVALGHELGMSVTAEGVEEDATLAELKRLGCDLAQGFGISRPLDADTFVAWLRDADGWHVPAVPAPNVPRPPQPARASR